MTNSNRRLFIFGSYLVLVGLGFMIAPHQVLSLFGLSAGDDIWIRMVGLLASIIGIYYLLVARARIVAFYKWTVPIRYFAAGFMLSMFLLGKVGSAILLFAAIDAIAATWTWIELKSHESASQTDGDESVPCRRVD